MNVVSCRGIAELQLTGDKKIVLLQADAYVLKTEVNLGRCCLLTLHLPNALCYSAPFDARPLLT